MHDNIFKTVIVRGQVARIHKCCPHRDIYDWDKRYRLANDVDGSFNHCVLCASDASNQVHGGMTMEEIGNLEGISKAAVNFALNRAMRKYKKNLYNKASDTYEILELEN
jgi:hypothetical protein